ncbi:MAG TPA: ABC transporter substrate-binding protein, partial [Blastocatellia bacterium]|nr:ABC transporter substrate-binding protein [Blastocatellia bacterium]
MNLNRPLAVSIATLCALCLACQPHKENSLDSPVIRVGIVTSLTGAEAKFGQAQRYGYEMALDEINAQGGVLGKKVELVYQDDTSKDEVAMTAVDKLTEDPEIRAIIGAYKSSATFPASAVANRYRVPMLVPSAITDEITRQGYEWVFRVCAPASAYGRAMVDFLTKAAAVARLAVVYENTQFGSSVARAALEQAPRAGIEIVAFEAYDPGGTDFTPLLTRVKSSGPEAVLFVSYLADATLLIRQAKEIDLNPKAFT